MNAQIGAAQARAITAGMQGCSINMEIGAEHAGTIKTHARTIKTHARGCTVIAAAGPPGGGARAAQARGGTQRAAMVVSCGLWRECG